MLVFAGVGARRPRVAALFVAGLSVVLPAGSARAGDGDAVALVNGSPISRNELVSALMDAHGVDMLQQLVVLELVRAETYRRGLQVSVADVEREERESIDRIAREAGLDPHAGDESQRLKALQTLLDEKRISMAEFKLSMERNSHLRKLVEQELKFDEPTLREEFARTYGERVVVRHIQIPAEDARRLNEVVTRLARGEDFQQVARQFSTNAETAPRGGQMEPFSFMDETIPAALRDAAFSLRPEQISTPIRAGQMIHVLQLVQRIPPDNVRFEQVREQVERSMRERAMPKRMAQIATELFKQARVVVIDARLKQKYEEFLARGGAAPGG